MFRRRAILTPGVLGRAFSPSDLTPLAWYDPSDTATLSLSGNELLTMSDKSGNGYTATTPGATGPDSGTQTINGLNALDHIGEYLRVESFPLGDTNHIFVVANMTGATNAETSIMGFNDGSGSNFDWRWRSNSTTSTFNASYRSGGSNPSGNFAESPATNHAGSAKIWEVEHDAAADTVKLRIDGADKAQSNTNTLAGSYSGQFVLMATELSGFGATGKTGEVIIFNRVLTGSDLTNLRTYLKNKWGTA